MNRVGVFIASFFLVSSCAKHDLPIPNSIHPELTQIPEGFPEIDYPEGNEFTKKRWTLGKRLFYDPILSIDKSTSCASCHDPKLAFSDDKAVSFGASNEPGTRNSPTLTNVAYHPYYTREGAVPTLEMQVLVPIQEHNEFNTNIVTLCEILNADAEYVKMSQDAYGRNPDPYVITRALANFERTLISGNSAYDQFVYQGDINALNPNEKSGMELFNGKAMCSSCHSGFNFTNYAFENNGLYLSYQDPGRYRFTLDSVDLAKFKVPTLRNVALSAPYMHDGSIETLKAVLEHYSEGLKEHPNQSDVLKPLMLNTQEKADLIAFLKALTDEQFLSNPKFDDNKE